MSAIWVLAPLAGALVVVTILVVEQIAPNMALPGGLLIGIPLAIGAGLLAAEIDRGR